MARTLATEDPRPERKFAVEFEEPSHLTLRLAYEQRGRYSGGAYHPMLKRTETFSGAALPKALAAATRFDAGRIRPHQIAAASGPPEK